jgi:hypothetical protein
MPWDLIIAAVLKLLEGCLQKDDEATVLARLRGGGLRVRIGVRGVLHEQGLRGRELAAGVDQMMDQLSEATDAELKGLVSQAKAGG